MTDKGLASRIKNKIKLVKAKQKVARGKKHDIGWSRSESQEYWKVKANLEEDNRPESYANSPANEIRAKFFLERIKNLDLKEEEPILELGTNAGYIFSYLFQNGFKNLTGIEINSNALNIMKEKFHEAYNNCQIINDSLENSLPNFGDNSFSLVYSTGVLMHIHPESNFIFEHISRIVKKYIITIEGEKMISRAHFPRDYKKIFENLGFRQISFEMTKDKIPNYANLHCRIFSKNY